MFNTVRSEMGELVYRLKNRGDINGVQKIIELAAPFLDAWDVLESITCVMPVPPTKKIRMYQPAFVVAEKIADYLQKQYIEDVLENHADVEAKSLDRETKQQHKENPIIQLKMAKHRHSLLLVDDIFQSGITATNCVRTLRQDANIEKIYFLALTKTRT